MSPNRKCYDADTNRVAQKQSRGTGGPATFAVQSRTMSSAGPGQRDPDAEIGGGAEHDYSGSDEDSFHGGGASLSACPGDLLPYSGLTLLQTIASGRVSKVWCGGGG